MITYAYKKTMGFVKLYDSVYASFFVMLSISSEDCLGFRFSVIAWLLFSLLLLDS
ncbi:hypothetical protein HanHA300_Chr14g0516841 [Helianthus annuus]|nr:hypothetical protein HanHA300_Chr14g0516841 [Helianthus annuus]KAJ0485016.1 hypothetical protein HanHA89_Chr14g0563411 [Helianthus annuus]KAJ0655569.1 hypothetical protein HanLR1_Chr14g0525781 [Helianthus annuus]KAJ0659252.1 hypothetical protein HanOQP8_Chr14g0523981 [Helianthus annuus]